MLSRNCIHEVNYIISKCKEWSIQDKTSLIEVYDQWDEYVKPHIDRAVREHIELLTQNEIRNKAKELLEQVELSDSQYEIEKQKEYENKYK